MSKKIRSPRPRSKRRLKALRRKLIKDFGLDEREFQEEPATTDEGLDPGIVILHLISDLDHIEAVARSAEDALEAIPTHPDPEKRRALRRLYALVQVTAETATAALDRADDAHRKLDEQMLAAGRDRRSKARASRGPRHRRAGRS